MPLNLRSLELARAPGGTTARQIHLANGAVPGFRRARQAYAVVATSEMARYADIILRKGLVKE